MMRASTREITQYPWGEFSCRLLTTRFSDKVGQRCSHVLNCKPPSNHILVVPYNVEGHGHELPDFHASTFQF